jgi:hypothetical protein
VDSTGVRPVVPAGGRCKVSMIGLHNSFFDFDLRKPFLTADVEQYDHYEEACQSHGLNQVKSVDEGAAVCETDSCPVGYPGSIPGWALSFPSLPQALTSCGSADLSLEPERAETGDTRLRANNPDTGG